MTEMLDVVDEEDKVIRQEKRSVVKKKALLYRASYVIVTNKKGEFFVQKRSANKDLWPSFYEIGIGETVNTGESYDTAAARGLSEEIGIKATPRLLFAAKYRSVMSNENMKIYGCVVDKKLKFADEEVSEGFFVPEDKLKKMLNEKDFVPMSVFIIKKYVGQIKK